MAGKDIGQVAKTLEKNMEGAEDDDEDSDGIDEAPIFTPELARLKAKEQGKPMPVAAADDAEMDADDDDDGKGGGDTKGKGIELPKVDPASLPADLRMDEYSDDDDDDNEKDVGNLLLGKVRRQKQWRCNSHVPQVCSSP